MNTGQCMYASAIYLHIYLLSEKDLCYRKTVPLQKGGNPEPQLSYYSKPHYLEQRLCKTYGPAVNPFPGQFSVLV